LSEDEMPALIAQRSVREAGTARLALAPERGAPDNVSCIPGRCEQQA
jgi:hypothetical protein